MDNASLGFPSIPILKNKDKWLRSYTTSAYDDIISYTLIVFGAAIQFRYEIISLKQDIHSGFASFVSIFPIDSVSISKYICYKECKK